MGTYFEEPHKQNDRLAIHVHLQSTVDLLSDVPHVLVVARFSKHSLCGRPSLPQQHQHLLVKVRVTEVRLTLQQHKQAVCVQCIIG